MVPNLLSPLEKKLKLYNRVNPKKIGICDEFMCIFRETILSIVQRKDNSDGKCWNIVQ